MESGEQLKTADLRQQRQRGGGNPTGFGVRKVRMEDSRTGTYPGAVMYV